MTFSTNATNSINKICNVIYTQFIGYNQCTEVQEWLSNNTDGYYIAHNTYYTSRDTNYYVVALYSEQDVTAFKLKFGI